MSINLPSGARLIGANPAAVGGPTTFGLAIYPTVSQARRYMQIANPTNVNMVAAIGIDVSVSPATKASAILGSSGQALGNQTVQQNVWQIMAMTLTAANLPQIVVNGAKAVGSGGYSPVGLSEIVIGGRASDFTSGPGGNVAHAAQWTRVLADIELAFWGGFGNPKFLAGLASYWKCKANQLVTVTDEVGNNPLTGTNDLAGTNESPFMTYPVALPPNLILRTGTPISIPLDVYFADVQSAFTCSVMRLASAGAQVATAATAGANTQIIPINYTGTSFAVGDWLKIGGNPYSRVIWSDVANALVLVDTPQSWNSGAAINRVVPSAVSVAGTSVVANALGGTPSSATSLTNCLLRSTTNALTPSGATLTADSGLFNIQVSSVAPSSIVFRPRKRRLFVNMYSRR